MHSIKRCRNTELTGIAYCSGYGSTEGIRPPHARGTGHSLRPALVHRRARLPQVGRDRARRVGGRVRGGHRLRRVLDRGLRAGVGIRHRCAPGPVDLPGAAVGDPAATTIRRGCSATSPCRTARRRGPTRGTCCGVSCRRPTTSVSPAMCTPRSNSSCSSPARTTTGRRPSRSTTPAISTRPCTTPLRTSVGMRSTPWNSWASRWSSATTRVHPASRRSTCASPTHCRWPTT